MLSRIPNTLGPGLCRDALRWAGRVCAATWMAGAGTLDMGRVAAGMHLVETAEGKGMQKVVVRRLANFMSD